MYQPQHSFRAVATVLGIVLALNWTRPASSQEIERGKIKSLDLGSLKLVVTTDGKERELVLTERTQVLDRRGDSLAAKLKGFSEGADIFFRVNTRDGKEVVLALKLAGPADRVQPRRSIESGTIKAIDLEKKTITLTSGDHDRELAILGETQVLGVRASELAERFQGFKAGADVRFQADERDGQAVLIAIAAGSGEPRQPGQPGRPVSPDHKHFKPLTELGTAEYQGFAGGLYPDGKNERPAAHEAAGKKLAAEVQPLDREGKPAAAGKIVLLSIGMSNASQASGGFRGVLREFDDKHPALVFVDGAQGGMTAEVIDDPKDGNRGTQYWNVVDERLKQAGLSREQVQAVWIKQADGGPREGFAGYAKKLQGELKTIVQILHERFPNLKLCYLSSRTYGGFATTALNPEPYAYESGFAVKWLIEEQLDGDPALNYDPAKGIVKAPWLSWGPYLWANGEAKRGDGSYYEPSDFAEDGTHHSPAGSRKIGQLMLDFFQRDTTARPWFLEP